MFDRFLGLQAPYGERPAMQNKAVLCHVWPQALADPSVRILRETEYWYSDGDSGSLWSPCARSNSIRRFSSGPWRLTSGPGRLIAGQSRHGSWKACACVTRPHPPRGRPRRRRCALARVHDPLLPPLPPPPATLPVAGQSRSWKDPCRQRQWQAAGALEILEYDDLRYRYI